MFFSGCAAGRLKTACAFLCVFFGASFFGVSQETDSGADIDYADYWEDEGLVITASRVQEPTAYVPAQVSVITAEEIAESGASSLGEVLETVPGVRFSGAMSGSGSETISMRGFGENSFGRVLVLVDGVRLNNPDMQAINWNAVSLADIERIEVLDGSAGVQYGNSAVGGVVNVITKKTGSKRTVIDISGGSLSAGGFFYNRESAAHFQPFSWGNFSFSAEHRGANGWRERQESQIYNITAGANINIGAAMSVSLNAFFSNLFYQLPGALSKAQFEDNPRQAVNLNDENSERHFGGGLGWCWTPAKNVEVNLPLSFRGKLIKADMPSNYSPAYTERRVYSFEARPQALWTAFFGGMSLRLSGGIDVHYDGLGADVYSDADYNIKSRDFSMTEWTVGPYLTARISPLTNLSISAGARLDTAIIHGENGGGTANGDKTFNAFVYDAGIVYNPLEKLKLYAKFASLFRYPFVDELAQAAGFADKFNDDLEPEKGFNAEIGTSYNLGDIFKANANVFFMQIEDEIAFNNNTNANENLDKTRHFGINAGVGFTPIKQVSFDASYTFVSATFIAGDNKDKHIPLVPEHKIYGSLVINMPFGLSFGPDIEYTSAMYYGQDFGNEAETMSGYVLLGAKARFVFGGDRGRFAVQVIAKNLLDTRYSTYGTWYFYNGDNYSSYPADARSITVSASYQF